MTEATAIPTPRPRIVIIGPHPSQSGGFQTFIRIVLSSPYLRERYELIHLDISRGQRGFGKASQWALINVLYFVHQAARLVQIWVRYRPRVMQVPLDSSLAFWKDAAFILMARAMGMRVVARLHSGWFERYYRQSSHWVQRLISWVLGQVDVVVALSNRWKQFLQEIRPGSRVEVVPNTIEPMFAEAVDQASDIRHREADTILFVGNLTRYKGIFDILKAAPLVLQRRPAAKFLLVGAPVGQEEQSRLDQAYADAHLDGAVQFLGRVTGRAKLDLFLKASVFILPSYAENLSYAVLEAMGAGLPVITTPVGGIPELVEEGRNGFLIQPGDYQALAERIIQLLEDAPLRAAMSRANVERIQADYLPQVALRRLDYIYRGLL